MPRFLNHSLAAALAFTLTLGTIGAIVTVPQAQASAPAALVAPELA